jgi:hypothetical protein
MATNNFKRMPKMETTEPSVDEVGAGMKKGGKTKKMAMGGNPMVGALMSGSATRPRSRMASQAMSRAPAQMSMGSDVPSVMRKKGGEIESKATHMSEMKKIGKVEKELKSHESKSASKGHKGLKTGGAIPRFKEGGHVAMACKDGGGFTAMKKMQKC